MTEQQIILSNKAVAELFERYGVNTLCLQLKR